MEIAEGRVKEIEEPWTWLFMVLRYSLEDCWLAGGLVFCKREGKLILERLWARIRQGTSVIQRRTAESRKEDFLVLFYYANIPSGTGAQTHSVSAPFELWLAAFFLSCLKSHGIILINGESTREGLKNTLTLLFDTHSHQHTKWLCVCVCVCERPESSSVCDCWGLKPPDSRALSKSGKSDLEKPSKLNVGVENLTLTVESALYAFLRIHHYVKTL